MYADIYVGLHPEYQYLNLLSEILKNGIEKPIFDSKNRLVMPDKSLKSVFGRQIRFDLRQGFPLYTTKKTFFKGAIEEMLWFLKDNGNVTKLAAKGVHIWDEWAFKDYQAKLKGGTRYNSSLIPNTLKTKEEFIDFLVKHDIYYYIPLHYTGFTGYNYIKEDEEGYAHWKSLNQIQWVIENLPKHPERKSYYVTCWNPTEAYQMAEECGNESVVLVACHIDHIVNIQGGRLNLRVGIRSNDMFLGNPFNVAQYGALAHMYSFLTGFPVGDLVVNIDDCHLYYNHFEQAQEQLTRKPYPFPNLTIKDRGQKRIEDFVFEDFNLDNYQSYPALKGEVTVVGGY